MNRELKSEVNIWMVGAFLLAISLGASLCLIVTAILLFPGR